MDFTNKEIKKIIMSMKNNKATEFDGIQAQAQKVSSTKIGKREIDGFI
jgi:hypothetical protein